MKKGKQIFTMAGFALLLLVAFGACKSSGGGNDPGKDDKRPRYYYDQYYVKFALREIDGLREEPLDSLPWKEGIQNLPQNGQVAYWFLKDMETSLSGAHIRAEYVYRRQPWCSTSDSLFLWLKQTFINEERNGQMITEQESFPTYSGKDASFMSLKVPETQQDTITRPARYMAWAYVPQEDYYVGFVYTAFDQARYDRGVVLFRELVGTFEEPQKKQNQ